MPLKLHYTQLKKTYDAKDYNFVSTKNIEKYEGLIDQDRALRALELGLNIKSYGYNIFTVLDMETKSIDNIKKIIEKVAVNENTPKDICYVYNFSNPKQAKVLLLDAGMGESLSDDLTNLIDTLLIEVPRILECKTVETRKTMLDMKYKNTKEMLLKIVSDEAKEHNFGVETTAQGIYFLPIIDGKMITEEQFNNLSDDEKENIAKTSDEIQSQANIVMSKLKIIEAELKTQLKNIEFGNILGLINYHFSIYLEKYKDFEHIFNYLKQVKEDIIEDIDVFNPEDEQEEDSPLSLIPWYNKKNNQEQLNKYKINILVNNKDLKGAPVILEHNLSYNKLIGELEYDSEFGNLNTDFMKLKPGLLHMANGGYLILDAYDVLSGYNVYETLKNIIKTKKLLIEPQKDFSTGFVVSYVKPEAIDFNVKIIIVGLSYYYNLLCYHDTEFKEIFKIKADFDIEMDNSKTNIEKFFGLIKHEIESENLLDFDIEALVKILEYAERLAENQKKLSANFTKISEILIESSYYAKLDKVNIVSAKYITKAINERVYMNNLYEQKLNELLIFDIISVETVGARVGQINGLAVLEDDDHIFGKPSKITVTTCIGDDGIINIEEEAKLSGNIHNKGISVLSGYLGHKYSQDFKISVTCRVCFEQSYNAVDGDSASSTELFAILSSLSDIPINQEIAVTGSINQFGFIQPIGGATYKIEGFYDLCKKRGLTGTQGVIIPYQNIDDLVLNDEIIEDIKNEMFHIYPIKTIDEGLFILMGVEAGELVKNKYPKNTVHKKVYDKLKKYYDIINDSDEDK